MQSSKILRKNAVDTLISKYRGSKFPKEVKIVEVGPRDGLQNEKQFLPTNEKINFINKLNQTGLKYIEATSFVSKKWVPQLGDAEEVYARINKNEGSTYPVLVPNVQGLEQALKVGVKEIAVFGAASETFSQKNTNCSIDEALNRFRDVFKRAEERQLIIRGYVSCVMGCPYEGEVNPQKVAEITQKLLDMGCYEVSLGDTIGTGNPQKTKRLLEAIKDIPKMRIACHFHDTNDTALENILVALENGYSNFDSSVAGLGGCPYAKKSTGNVCTENLVYLLHGLGVETGVDLQLLNQVGLDICKLLGRESNSFIDA